MFLALAFLPLVPGRAALGPVNCLQNLGTALLQLPYNVLQRMQSLSSGCPQGCDTLTQADRGGSSQQDCWNVPWRQHRPQAGACMHPAKRPESLLCKEH